MALPHRPQVSPSSPWWRGRRPGLGGWAFVLNRIAALGLVLYLGLHLWTLRLLLRGEAAWNAFIQQAKQPLFLALDVLLFAGLLYHGLNGVRVSLIGLGVATRHHRCLFWGLMALAVLLLGLSAWGLWQVTR